MPRAGGQAMPMTYGVNSRQYVAIMARGHHFMETPIGDAVIAYALPARSWRWWRGVVPATGIEPVTFGLQNRCSTS